MITAKPTLEIVMHIELIDYLRFKIFILCSAFNIRSMLNYFYSTMAKAIAICLLVLHLTHDAVQYTGSPRFDYWNLLRRG